MTSFEDFFVKCKCCEAFLIGKTPKTETVSQSALYSDGMIINDLIPLNPQKLVLCPACGYLFWLQQEDCLAAIAVEDEQKAYQWNSWRFFGCNLLDNKGRMALINHYWVALEKLNYIAVSQEIIIRKSLLWAYNDLYRDAGSWQFSDFLNGKISFNYWLSSKRFDQQGVELFSSEKERFTANLERLIYLLESSGTAEIAELAELYRELGDFDKASTLLQGVLRRTHFIGLLNKHVLEKNKKVFKVAG